MTPEERAEKVFDDFESGSDRRLVDHVTATIREAVSEERERCAKICDTVQKEGNDRAHASADPGEGSDGAAVSAERIRAG